MSDGIPDSLRFGIHTIGVREASLDRKLGYLDTRVGEIVIHADQPKAGKHVILLHEMIHAVAEYLKEERLISRQPDERFVTHLAGGLLPMLVLSGLWNGVSQTEMLTFLEDQHDKE